MLLRRKGWRSARRTGVAAIAFGMLLFLLYRNNFSSSKGRHIRNGAHGNSERRHVLYVKMIKCASTTLVSILHRFGYTRNLSFVLPVGKRIYIGWPYPIHETFYRPTLTGHYHLLTEHALYDHARMTRLFGRPPAIITSVRQPFEQFLSMYDYYNLANIAGVADGGGPDVYIRSVQYYEQRYSASNASALRYCIPDSFSMSKNLMSFNLGYQHRLDTIANTDHANDWLNKIDEQFELILIVEYFTESIVLLRRLLGWSHKDILFQQQNLAKEPRDRKHSPEVAAIYRKWSAVDYLLYDYANRTLWSKIAKDGDDFWNEVRRFKLTLLTINAFCMSAEPLVRVPTNKWSEEFVFAKKECALLENEILELIKKQHEASSHGKLPQPVPNKYFC